MIAPLNHRRPIDSESSLAPARTIGDSTIMGEQSMTREHWQAIDPKRNIARDYELLVSTDLFGWTLVERRWGRIGAVGQRSCRSFANQDAAARFIASVRRRRGSAQGRIGTAYRRIQV